MSRPWPRDVQGHTCTVDEDGYCDECGQTGADPDLMAIQDWDNITDPPGGRDG